MTFADWISEPVNWVFLAIGLVTLGSAFRVVTTQSMVRAALYLVAALAGTAAIFILLSAEFLAFVLVLVYIGAVVVLFLFGIMITRAPTGRDSVKLDNDRRIPAALVSLALFAVLAWGSITAFGTETVVDVGEATLTEILADGLLGRWVIPFEVVGFILLAALIGGITIARRDLSPAEEEMAE